MESIIRWISSSIENRQIPLSAFLKHGKHYRWISSSIEKRQNHMSTFLKHGKCHPVGFFRLRKLPNSSIGFPQAWKAFQQTSSSGFLQA